jgi:RimJ/RimL family protein N-acetyltransferase
MVDPSDGLESFQQALLSGQIELQPGILDNDLYLHVDEPNGEKRITYVRLDGTTVTAFVNFAWSDPIEGVPCLGVGYAVPEAYRNQGRAKEIVNAAISDMQHTFGRAFFVEAIVGTDNIHSQHVAAQVISAESEAVTEQHSGLPALRYVRKVERPSPKCVL